MQHTVKDLVDLGLPVIPLCSHTHQNMSSVHVEHCKCAGKTPLIKGWQTHSETSVEDLIEWQKSFKTFNIGLPLGEASGYCGIDVDGEAGITLLMDMSKGELPGTWEFTTGDGSRLLYLIPAGMKTKKFKQTGDNKHEECALLCNGQQTVIPPSIHKSGRPYLWIENHSPWDMDCAVAPKWLLELIKIDEPEWKADSNFNFEVQTNDVLSDLASEFTSSEMSFDLPPDVSSVTKNVRAQIGKSGHKIVVTDELMTQRIGEGARDNTMTAIIGHYCANRDLRRIGKEFIYSLCLKHNRDYCDPPLEDKSIRDKVEYFFTAEGMKDATFKGAGRKDRAAFEPTNMAIKVLEQLKEQGIHLHFDQFSKIYYYTTASVGPWRGTRNYTLIQKWIREVIISEDCGDSTWDKKSYIEEVRVALEESFTVPYKCIDDFDLGAHSDTLCDFIVVNNGMVDWRNKVLTPWNPEYKTTVSFDVEYDPQATCPRFEKYMEEWLPSLTVRQVMQEYLGYCLIPNTNFRKALFLYGKGKNGKSMLIEFLQKFFGDYAANLSYDGLFSRFGPATLKDKLVNIFDDTTVSFTKETSIAKNLIAGGSISAEYKGRDMFSFNNVTRLIFSSQETPRTSDNTIAWYDRWYFIKFPNSFRPSNKAKFEIEHALAEEHAGIFNWMIDGLIRLMRNDEFTASDTLSLYNMEYRSQNDNVTQFIHNLCTAETGEDISITDLYKVYNVWIATEQLRPVSKKVFTARVEDMGFDRDKGYIAGKSGQSFFKGLQLNKMAEDFIENALEINIALSH